YIEFLLDTSERIDRGLKIFLAIASSSSIGAWVVWSQLSYLWGSIIAISQVAAAVNPYLPYQSRIKEYTQLLRDLEELMIQMEFNWHAVAEGELSSEEINSFRFKIRSEKQKAL